MKTFDYLGYKLKGNNKEGEHIRKLKGKANGVLGRIWSLAERKFKNNWKLKMRLFDTMVKGVATYGTEQWGWKGKKEIETLQMKYIRLTMKLKKNTPWHTIRKEMDRRKIATEMVKRAMNFDIKMSKARENTWEKICSEQIRKREEEEWRRGERGKEENGKGETLESAGISIKMWNDWLERGEDRTEEIIEKLETDDNNEVENRVNKSEYIKELK